MEVGVVRSGTGRVRVCTVWVSVEGFTYFISSFYLPVSDLLAMLLQDVMNLGASCQEAAKQVKHSPHCFLSLYRFLGRSVYIYLYV